MNSKKIFKFIVSIIICQMAGFVGAIFTMPQIEGWYKYLNKPSFTPPGYFIGLVWTILFFLMGISLYLVWSKNFKCQISDKDKKIKAWNRFSEKLWIGAWREENAVLIFIFQLILNILWSILFFGLQSPGLAFIELLMLWWAILYTIANFYRISKPAAYLLIPYIAWVSFAGVLNFILWRMN
ncbi:MAG: tryptophan-rich sensory protein [Candidatus Nealsonbacteria bacterium]|nr:tryptophan-rich sensory protein [Candidatus Nealsonbacteria bacterium]